MAENAEHQNKSDAAEIVQREINRLIGETMDMLETSCVPESVGGERFDQIKRLFKAAINRARTRILREL